ncbi:MAG: glycerophosphodiester phosphodiesterase [Clostridia bacterium]|nr:glycerophosphodiester phosphodiesterase [Clostridia bacterium]
MLYTAVWAHRGASAYAPENTMSAFLLACRLGADGIELDVHLTADGEVVVCHDANIKRTSDGKGVIEEMTLEELYRYDFGYPDVFGTRFKGEYIPTLKEVYRAVLPFGVIINTELKRTRPEIVKAVLQVEEECGAAGAVIYSSFEHDYLKELKALNPAAPVAPLYGTDGAFVELGKKLNATALHPAFGGVLADTEYVKKAHDAGLRVHPYTPNSIDDLTDLVEAGVDAVITNYPDRAIEIRNKKLRRFI